MKKTLKSIYKNDEKYLEIKLKHNFYLPILILDSLFFKPTCFSAGKIEITDENKKYIKKYINSIDNKENILNNYIKNTNFKLKNKINYDKIVLDFIKKNNLKNQKYEFMDNLDELYATKNVKTFYHNNNKIVENLHLDGIIPNFLFGIKTFRILILIDKDENDNSYTYFYNKNNYDNANYWVF